MTTAGAIAVETLERVWSPQRRNHRDVDVYLPASYHAGRTRHPVLYMHDGQNLSDPAKAFAGTWNLTEALATVAHEGIEPIVVGIHNRGRERLTEYSPFPDRQHGRGEGDRYLSFIATTLKPRIDRRFRTKRGREHTAMLGSSMGGLISLYAFFTQGSMIGAAGAMSPALWYGDRKMFDALGGVRPRGRIYLDIGTDEGAATLRDARYMAERLESAGFRPGQSLLYVEEPGGRHTEAHWSRRLARALSFLFSAG